jgi:F-type H+-transporting ATPase subunit a
VAAGQHSPLEQFAIKKLVPIDIGGIDLSFTNSAMFMVIALVGVVVFMNIGMRRGRLVPGRWQSMAELAYEFIANLIRDTIGNDGRRYFPIVFTLFLFILFGNMLGMLPYSFTFTSQIAVTFAMAIFVFAAVTVLGFVRHGAGFFSFFVPGGVHWAMLILLIPIEIISYLSRPISLSVRLFANMLAGHTLIKVFSGFVWALGVLGFIPLAFVAALVGLEIVIAFLQAYVFAILTCLYINDSLHLH